jgi:BirA family biotin operon repressor/biotin-[acetyl-CoA-carboxylase] ligase
MSLGPIDYERALAAAGLTEVTVFHRQSTGSTNDDARMIVESDLPNLEAAIAIVVAETQTKGRGRGSNVWLSLQGSIALTITMGGVDVSRLSVLPLGVGSVVAAALRHLGVDACVKWPNDILINDRKVAGILCESSLLAGSARVFIGIGINVDAASADLDVTPNATTLSAHGLNIDRPWLVANLTTRVVDLVRGKASGRDIVEAWKAVSVPWWDEEVSLLEGDVLKRMTVLDVSPEGQLVVRDETGVVRSLVSGDVRRLRTAGA